MYMYMYMYMHHDSVFFMYTHNICTVCVHITSLQLSLAKNKGDFLGVMVMESGYGSALPTPVIAHLSKTGSAARSGQLNIGDHIISVNGINMVGMPVKVCIEQLKVSDTIHAHVCTHVHVYTMFIYVLLYIQCTCTYCSLCTHQYMYDVCT